MFILEMTVLTRLFHPLLLVCLAPVFGLETCLKVLISFIVSFVILSKIVAGVTHACLRL